jgi:hypothetical protein
MEAIVNRLRATPGLSTIGEWDVPGITTQMFSMERAPDSPDRIPAGRYQLTLHTPHSAVLVKTLAAMVAKYPSMKNVTQMPQLNSPAIAQRGPILIHPQNKPTDGEGCLGAGLDCAPDDSEILRSQDACAELYPVLIAAINLPEGCYLTINDPSGQSVTDIDLE